MHQLPPAQAKHKTIVFDGPVNLDTYRGDLFAWGAAAERAPVKAARGMFPHRPPGYVKATKSLANYAFNRGAALYAKSIKDKVSEQVYRRIMDDILLTIPVEFLWF